MPTGELILSGPQSAVYIALNEKNSRFGDMYFGALHALNNPRNPDRISQAGNSLRELMEIMARELPKVGGVSAENPENEPSNFKGQVHILKPHWKTAKEGYPNGWTGEIVRELTSFLQKLEGFFDWAHNNRPPKKVAIENLLRTLDGGRSNLPEVIEQLEIKKWDRIREFFEGATHHRADSTLEDFNKHLNSLEKFLMDYLRPQAFEDIQIIRGIIHEVEGQ